MKWPTSVPRLTSPPMDCAASLTTPFTSKLFPVATSTRDPFTRPSLSLEHFKKYGGFYGMMKELLQQRRTTGCIKHRPHLVGLKKLIVAEHRIRSPFVSSSNESLK